MSKQDWSLLWDCQEAGERYFEALCERLRNKSVATSILVPLRNGRKQFFQEHEDEVITMPEIIEIDRESLKKVGPSVFENKVLKHLPQPHLITADDFVNIAIECFAGIDLEDKQHLAKAYGRLLKRIDTVRFELPQFSLGRWRGGINTAREMLGETEPLWATPSGFIVLISLKAGFFDLYELTAHVHVCATSAACRAFTSQLEAVLPVLYRCSQVVFPDPPDPFILEALRSLGMDANNKPSIDDPNELRYLTASNEEDSQSEQEPTWLISPERRSFIATCLDAVFHCDDSRATSISNRIRNAVLLLTEGESQENPAIGFVLYFSAIEALICQNTGNVVDQLARHVAAIREPIGRKRPEVIKSVKSLYKTRSKMIHEGEQSDVDEGGKKKLFELAASVLGAVVSWRQYQRRVGGEPSAKEFFKELAAAEQSGERMVGVPDRGK